MSPTPPVARPVRSADELNARIRALWPHPAVRLSDADRAEYEVLVAEWAVAVRGEVVEAA